jgi:hypothetical protein
MRGPLLLLLSACLSIPACGPGPAKPTEPIADSTATYLPGSDEHVVSPLAQLMRDMTVFGDSTKARLASGRELLPYPEGFKAMLTAGPTPGMVDHRTYDPFAFAYLHQLDSLYKVPVEQRSAVYDGLVSACAACHQEVCPGPLDRIKKLRPAAEPSAH